MNYLIYMDPFVDYLEKNREARSYVLRYELMPGCLNRQISKKEDNLLVFALDNLLDFNDLRGIFKRDKIAFATANESEVSNLISVNKINCEQIVKEILTNSEKEDVFEFITRKLKNYNPDIIVGWGMMPAYLGELFPDALVLEFEHSAFSRILGEADIVAVPKTKKDLEKLRASIESIDDSVSYSSQQILKQGLLNLIHYPEEILIPEFRGQTKKYFYPGHFPSIYSLKFTDFDNDLETLHYLLDKTDEKTKILYTKHPLYKTCSSDALDGFVRDCERIADLSVYDFDPNLTIRAIEESDCVINSHSKTVYLAFALDKPVVDIANFFTKHFTLGSTIESPIIKSINAKLLYWHIHCRISHPLLNAGCYKKFLKDIYEFYRSEKHDFPIFTNDIEIGNLLKYASLQLTSKKLRRAPNEYDKLKAFAFNDDIKNICTDVFDTLVYRPVNKPTDVFYYMSGEVSKIVKNEKFDFFYARINSEWIALAHAASCNKEDTTLDNIYETMQRVFSISPKAAKQIKQLELDYELRFLHPRKSMQALIKLFQQRGKRIIAVSDMYLSSIDIERILNNCEYRQFDNILVSSEEGVTKRSGLLFKKLKDIYKINPAESVFIGDNYKSDVQNPKKYGFNSIHYPSAASCFETKVKHHQFYLVQTKHTVSSYLASIANIIFDNPYINFEKNTYASGKSSLVGYMYFGPFLSSFIGWLEKELERNGDKNKKILFCSRDCWLIKEIFDLYNDNSLKTEYFYLSRKSTLPLFRDENNAPLLIDKYNSKYNSKDFLKKYFNYEQPGKKFELETRAGKARFANYIANNYQDIIKNNNDIEYKNEIKNYIEYKTKDQDFVLIDSGARGTSRDALSDLLSKSINLYLLREYKYKRSCSNFIYTWHKESFNYYRPGRQAFISNFYEPILSACTEESCLGYKTTNQKIEPIVEKKIYDKLQYDTLVIQKGIRDFAIDAKRHYNEIVFEIFTEPSIEFFKAPIEAFHARQGEIEIFENLSASNEFCGNKKFTLLMPALPKENSRSLIKIQTTNSPKPIYRKATITEKKIDRFFKKYSNIPFLSPIFNQIRKHYINTKMKIK